eukprot:414546-Prorocentrum_minimum.AAC.1
MRGLLPPTPSGTPPGGASRRSACPIAWRGRATSRKPKSSTVGRNFLPVKPQYSVDLPTVEILYFLGISYPVKPRASH